MPFNSLAGITPKQLTDIYLLGLGVSEGIDFATTDSRIHHEAVVLGKEKLIPAS